MIILWYIASLAHYLSKRASLLRGHRKFVILEVGAGDGRLCHFLQMKLNEMGHGDTIEIIPTDNGISSTVNILLIIIFIML